MIKRYLRTGQRPILLATLILASLGWSAFTLWADAYAKAAAKVIATPSQAAIRKEGYAGITWGYKGNSETKQLSVIINLVVLTAHKAEK